MSNKFCRPFEILKLIRDGVFTNTDDLFVFHRPPVAPSTGFTPLTDFFKDLLEDLKKVGLITISNKDIKPTPRLNEFTSALKISLTQLKEYSEISLTCTPIFGLPSHHEAHSDIFVAMPFLAKLRPVFDDHIKNVASMLNLSVVRADDFFNAHSIISDIWDAINESKIIVADCTGTNPNVFYEIGIAHTLGKRVILIAQSTKDIPFDVRHVRTIIYDFTPRGMRIFEESLKATIEHELHIPESLDEVIRSNREVQKKLREIE